MSFSVAGVLSALGSVAGSSGGIAGQTGWLGYSSAKSLNKKTLEQQSAAQLALDEQLTKEGPSWSVEGLRKAGINPILAANGGNLGAITSSLSGSIGSGSSGSYPNPVIDALQAQNLKEQNAVLANSAKKLDTDTKVAQAELANHTAKTVAEVQNINADTYNKQRGATGQLAPFAVPIHRAWDDVKNWIRSFGSSISNSAKDFSQGSKKVEAAKKDYEVELKNQINDRYSPETQKKIRDWVNRHIGDPAEFYR